MAKNKKKMGSLKAGIIGAGIGAVAGVAATALSNKDTRKKLAKTVKEYRGKGKKAIEDFKNRAKDIAAEAQKEVKKLSKKK